MPSAVRFVDARNRRVEALAQAAITVSSRPLGWSGVMIEAGTNTGWEVDQLTVEQHYLALNTARTALTFEARIGSAFHTIVLPPGTSWFCPAGELFSHRVTGRSEFALLTITPQRFAAIVGGEPPPRTYGINSVQIDHLIRAMVGEAQSGNPGGPLFVDALATAASLAISQACRLPKREPPKRGLGSQQLARVLALIEDRLGESVTTADLAREAGLSESHFLHAFKVATGTTPHRHHIARRLERARQLLASGGAVLDVALDLGFSDQSHFTRCFRSAFGITPAAFIRSQ